VHPVVILEGRVAHLGAEEREALLAIELDQLRLDARVRVIRAQPHQTELHL
jgi:hypothetical protein